MNKPIRFVYVRIEGSYFRITPTQWVEVMKSGSQGGWDEAYPVLKANGLIVNSHPKDSFAVVRGSKERYHTSATPYIIVHHCQEWEPEGWEDVLKDFVNDYMKEEKA